MGIAVVQWMQPNKRGRPVQSTPKRPLDDPRTYHGAPNASFNHIPYRYV
jgi:hypothetical protein